MQATGRRQRLGFVATVDPDATQNVSPKGTTAVWDDDHLFFADIRSPQTVANIRRGSAVEINVVDPIARLGYRFKGRAVVHTPGSAGYADGIEHLRREGIATPEPTIQNIIVVHVQRALALVSPAYDDQQRTKTQIFAWWVQHLREALSGCLR